VGVDADQRLFAALAQQYYPDVTECLRELGVCSDGALFVLLARHVVAAQSCGRVVCGCSSSSP
jgi:hypothetical protein